MEGLKFNGMEFENVVRVNGVDFYSNPFINKGRGVKTDDGVILHPFDLTLSLLGAGYNYKDVFGSMGLTDNTLDASIEYAKHKLNRFIFPSAWR